MYEELYSPIPDVGAYLERLHLPEPEVPDREYLNRLIYAHQKYIVFENLDSYLYRRPVSLGTEELFEKIIVNGRGGFCFELNGLFARLLRELGYHAAGCIVRIVRKKDFPGRR